MKTLNKSDLRALCSGGTDRREWHVIRTDHSRMFLLKNFSDDIRHIISSGVRFSTILCYEITLKISNENSK